MKENRIEEDIEILDLCREYTIECGLSNNDFKNEIKALEHILSDYKRLLKENEELKETNTYLQKENDKLKKQRNIEPILINNKMYFIDNEMYNELIEDIKSNYISVQKVKDKIEELKQEKGKYGNCLIEMYEDELVNRNIKILQELLESED